MRELTRARVLTYGLGPANDIRGTDLRFDWPNGMRLTVDIAGQAFELRPRLLGRVMAYPVLAGMALAHVTGRDLAGAARAIEAVPPQWGRLDFGPLPGGAWLVRDEFKASTETVLAAFDVLAELPGRKLAVLGGLDEVPRPERATYRRFGEHLGHIASRIVVLGSGKFRGYSTGARAAGLDRTAIVDARSSVRAAYTAIQAELRPGDIVLVKGRREQHMERISLALQGREVGCDVEHCPMRGLVCDRCPALATGPGRLL